MFMILLVPAEFIVELCALLASSSRTGFILQLVCQKVDKAFECFSKWTWIADVYTANHTSDNLEARWNKVWVCWLLAWFTVCVHLPKLHSNSCQQYLCIPKWKAPPPSETLVSNLTRCTVPKALQIKSRTGTGLKMAKCSRKKCPMLNFFKLSEVFASLNSSFPESPDLSQMWLSQIWAFANCHEIATMNRKSSSCFAKNCPQNGFWIPSRLLCSKMLKINHNTGPPIFGSLPQILFCLCVLCR